MSTDSLCFVHASDLHLEQSLYGIAEIPPAMRKILIDAPYTAAKRVFDAAVDQHADFLLLTGDVLDPSRCGPRAIAFLYQQFERLDEKGVAVYWLGGQVDPPQRWTDSLVLPSNVFVFAHDSTFTYERNGHPVAAIIQCSASANSTTCRHSIAVGYEPNDPPSVDHLNVDFVALGGQHRHRVVSQSPLAQYAGSPQGRCPNESGSHGCTLVRINETEATTQRIETSAVRWHTERLTVPANATTEEFENKLGDRMLNLLATSGDRPLLVTWQLDGAIQSCNPGHVKSLLTWLRNEFADGEPAAWTVAIHTDPNADWPESWYEEDTILGDYLRAIRDLHARGEDVFEFQSQISQHQDADLAAALSSTDGQDQFLRKASALGVQLLRGDDHK